MPERDGATIFTVLGISAVLAAAACGSSSSRSGFTDPRSSFNGTDPGSGGAGFGPGGGGANPDSGVNDLGRDPITCAEAVQTHSYVGCDFWPTVTANNVFTSFDYAVVIANTQKTAATVTITWPASTNKTVTVAPGSFEKVILPWVSGLKGPSATATGSAVAMTESAFQPAGAYHLIVSEPVVVYQFNALEYKKSGRLSYSNDASLLLPSTAWTGNYRVSGIAGWSTGAPIGNPDIMGGYIAITALANGTHVTVSLGPRGDDLAGPNVPATKGGGAIQLMLDAGDVVELVTPPGDKSDLSGSLVTATGPVQVTTGIPCVNVPKDQAACDHVEESVMPAEALGKRYVLSTPTRPAGGTGKHVVRLYGSRDGTLLTYTPQKPGGCPATPNAGDVADCGLLTTDFIVEGSREFAVAAFTVGATEYDPSGMDTRGDPDQTTFASIEQFRTSYLFLSPDDYDVSYAVIAGPADANPKLDGKSLAGYTDIGGGIGVWRATLSGGQSGAHTLTADKPVGLPAMGYGSYTSYTYPGGLNLKIIAPPPPAPK